MPMPRLALRIRFDRESSPVLEKVHPLVWTGVIVLGVSMLMVFASKDEDVEELFN